MDNSNNRFVGDHENKTRTSAEVIKANEFNQVGGTTPDLLKNTPANIAKLEDLIEQCKGRQKYLAQTTSPSDGEDVRWYFCKIPLAERELGASVPRTDIVGKGDYFRFSIRDSLALEASFLQREDELLAYWWKEYAECSEGPSGSCKISDTWVSNEELYVFEEERVGVPVKGGLYEVDLTRRHCFPVYWNGENRRVLRGHWFSRKGGLDWLPVREDISEQLELAYRCQVWHRRTFQPSGLFAARVDLQGIAEVGLHALFTGEDDTWEAWLVFDTSSFALGRGNGIKLRRGFQTSGSTKPTQDELRQQKEEEMDDYCSQVPVGHLVFMVHGIGQRLEKANLVDDVGDFRRVTCNLAERFLSPYQRSTQRVLFIPCQWRKGLKLSGERAVEDITLDGVRGLRVTLSATVHDVLYYMSPIYCQDIVNSVSNQLNKLYAKFLKRNPHYDGKVSLYGHSLGSVLSYDILCHQECLTSHFPMHSVGGSDDRKQETQEESAARQTFEPSTSINPSTIRVGGDHDICHSTDCLPENTMVDDCSNSICSLNFNRESLDLVQLPSDKELAFSTPFVADDDDDDDGSNLNSTSSLYIGERDCDAKLDVTRDNLRLISSFEEEVESVQTRILQHESQIAAKSLLKNNDHSAVEKYEQDASRKRYTPFIRYTKLDFKVDTFFAVGSPLGVFLALRNIRIGVGKGQEYWQDDNISEEMPTCRQMFNIFHPFDPVAYRVEPLICKEYISNRPVIIPYHRGGKRLHIGFQEFTEDVSARSQAMKNSLNSLKSKVMNVFRSRTEDIQQDIEENKENERSYGSLMIEKLTGSEIGRVDHVLQDKTFQHPYISAIGSHTHRNYWRDPDTALFILKHLYCDIPEEPHEEPCDGGSHIKARVALFYEKDSMDEDLPLTFSDHSSIRNFSRKAKKALNSS
ncbi:hypothetical protein AXF42_Ash003714 [Apostasia shenzhenica]|uniref:DDHD domain-containing protein n=1 Tax=Apostasia shenzhenica TaxID=1088818 RepID=A0A2I0AHP9_9ASPA|nr:hypothetical protein AXF42_Ash003714 [Apostasia shenzhenica]